MVVYGVKCAAFLDHIRSQRKKLVAEPHQTKFTFPLHGAFTHSTIKLIIIIYRDFLHKPRRGSHVKSDKNTHTQSVINIHPLAHMLDS